MFLIPAFAALIAAGLNAAYLAAIAPEGILGDDYGFSVGLNFMFGVGAWMATGRALTSLTPGVWEVCGWVATGVIMGVALNIVSLGALLLSPSFEAAAYVLATYHAAMVVAFWWGIAQVRAAAT